MAGVGVRRSLSRLALPGGSVTNRFVLGDDTRTHEFSADMNMLFWRSGEEVTMG